MTLLPEHTASFAHDLIRHGTRTALVDAGSGDHLSYLDLQARVDEAVERLGRDTRRLVLLEGTNSIASIATYLAALQQGHPVLLAPQGRPGAVRRLVDTYDPDVLVTGPNARLEERRGTTEHGHDLHPDLALLLSTSGSTGACKLVRLSHANLQANAEAVATTLGIGHDDRAITSLPMAYCYGLSVLHSHLARGAALLLTDGSVVDETFWHAFGRHGATSFAGVPHTFDLLDRIGFEHLELPTLRTVTQAGGRLDPLIVRRYAELGRRRGWDLHVMYGQSEATARMACLPPELAASHPGSIGRAIPGGSFELELEHADSTEGELVYRGPNVMLGYAHGPADLAEGRTVHELRTGDLARVDDDGLFEIVGRRHRFVKPFGLRIDLDGLERDLLEVGIDALASGDDRGIVVATTEEHRAAAEQRVADLTGLAPVAVDVYVVPALPRLANGKPDHCAVLALRSTTATTRDPSNPEPFWGRISTHSVRIHPQNLRGLFREVLRLDELGADDTFVSLGGDSLSYVELSVRLEELLGELPAHWPTMSIADLERIGDDRPAARQSGVVRWTETSVALRAGAVGLIVATHAGLTDLRGGAHLLLAIAGWNFARFQVPATTPRLARSIGRILVPTLAWLMLLLVLTDDYAPRNLFLLHSQIGPDAWSPQWRYWFVEALVPILAALGALLCVPSIRRLEHRRPFGFALALTAVTFAFTLPASGDRIIHRPQTIVWIFALGWAAQRASSNRQRVAVSIASIVGAHLFFVDPEREGVLIVGMLLLLWLRAVPLVAPLHRVAGVLAAASLWIYLVQWQVYPTVVAHATPAAATLASLGAGVAIHAAWAAAGRRKSDVSELQPRATGA